MATTRTTGTEPENLNNSLDKQVGRAASAAHATLDKVSDAARPAIDRAAGSAHAAVDSLAEGAARTAAAVGQRGAQLQGLQERWTEQVRVYVRRNPIAALGMAAAGALILRSLLGRR